MSDGSNGKVVGLIAAKVACCGALVFAASGALAGAGGWLFGAGLPWLAAAGLALAAAAAILWRRAHGASKRLTLHLVNPVPGHGQRHGSVASGPNSGDSNLGGHTP